MPKKTTTKKPAFNYTAQNELPKSPNVKTVWDLKGMYYKSHTDPRIEQDIQKAEKAYLQFAKKWQKKPFTTSAKVLKSALDEKAALAAMPEAARAGRYFSLRTAIDVNDQKAEEALALLARRWRKISDATIFFPLTLGAVSKKKQESFLKNKALAPYHYYLERLWLGAQYHLSEAEEKIINLKSSQSYGRWTEMTEKLIGNTVITWKGEEMTLPEALENIDTLTLAERPKIWHLITDELQKLSAVAEHEFNAIITDVRTEDERRGYQKPYSATALSYEDTEKNIERLVAAVSSDGFAQSKRFYKLKATYLGKEKIAYSQRNAVPGTPPTLSFSEATEICRDVFYGLKPEYGQVFDTMLASGQIDVFPRKGKQGGAFMSGQVAQPTQVLLNHTPTFDSLRTLAHEMGHAIHTERSKIQPPFYEGHSIITAETASTLFEQLVFDAVMEQVDDKTKTILLHDRLQGNVSTIQRQIAFFNAELEIHNTIFEKGAMTSDELRDCMYRHLKSYLGPAISLDKKDGYSYVYIPHLRYGFYVYSYTFGILMSKTMAARYKEDNSYIERIDAFLTAGESANVTDIFALADIDTTAPDVFAEALQNHRHDIDEFAKLIK